MTRRIALVFPGWSVLYAGLVAGGLGVVAAALTLPLFAPLPPQDLTLTALWLAAGFALALVLMLALLCRLVPERLVALQFASVTTGPAADAHPPLPRRAGLNEVMAALVRAAALLDGHAQRLRDARARTGRDRRFGGTLRQWIIRRAISRRDEEADTVARLALQQVAASLEVIEGLDETVCEIADVVDLIGQVSQDSSTLTLDRLTHLAQGGGADGAAVRARELAEEASQAAQLIGQKIMKIHLVSRRTLTLMGEVATTLERIADAIEGAADTLECQDQALYAEAVPANLPSLSWSAAEAGPAGELAAQAARLRATVGKLQARLGLG